MRTVLFALLLIPSLVSAETLHKKSLEPVVRISDDIIYVTDKKGNDWAVITRCEIKPEDVKQFTVRGRVLRSGKVVKLNDSKHCEIETIQAA